jgi:hypothetical protein
LEKQQNIVKENNKKAIKVSCRRIRRLTRAEKEKKMKQPTGQSRYAQKINSGRAIYSKKLAA